MDDQTLHHFMEDLTPIVVLTTMTIAASRVISLIIGAFRHRAHLRARTDFHNRMMEKFSSAEEFTAYLQSDAGKSFFDNLANEPATPLNKILSSIKIGARFLTQTLPFRFIQLSFNTTSRIYAKLAKFR